MPEPLWILAAYAALSLVTLALFAWDKSAARRRAGRIPERTLWLWTLAGGFVGAWLGMVWLRHKSRHASFRAVATLAAVAHGGGWAWWWAR